MSKRYGLTPILDHVKHPLCRQYFQWTSAISPKTTSLCILIDHIPLFPLLKSSTYSSTYVCLEKKKPKRLLKSRSNILKKKTDRSASLLVSQNLPHGVPPGTINKNFNRLRNLLGRNISHQDSDPDTKLVLQQP